MRVPALAWAYAYLGVVPLLWSVLVLLPLACSERGVVRMAGDLAQKDRVREASGGGRRAHGRRARTHQQAGGIH